MLKVQLGDKNKIVEIEGVKLEQGEGDNYDIIGYQHNEEIKLISVASKPWAEGIINTIKNSLKATQNHDEIFKLPDINSKEFDVW